MSDIYRETFLGFVRVHVLYHASKERIFGLEMIGELKRHGYSLSPGTLYPILHAMEKAKYLRSEQEVVVGKTRKYYCITATGSKTLGKLQEKIRELTEEVLDEAGGVSRSALSQCPPRLKDVREQSRARRNRSSR